MKFALNGTHKVSVKQNKGDITKIHVDDKEVHHVRGVNFKQSVETAPTFTIETIGIPDMELDEANVTIKVIPSSMLESLQMLYYAVQSNLELRRRITDNLQDLFTRNISDRSFDENHEKMPTEIVECIFKTMGDFADGNDDSDV